MAVSRRRYRRRKSTAKKVGKSVKQYVKRKFDQMVEDKTFPTIALGSTAVSTSAGYVQCNSIRNGTDNGQRIGVRIRMKKIWFSFSFNIDPTVLPAITGGRNVRIMLVYDKQANGAVPTLTELLTNNTAGRTWDSPLEISGQKRYKILFDRNYFISPLGMSANNATSTQVVRRSINLHNKVAVYNSDTFGDIRDINTGSLLMFTAADGDVVMRYQTQLYYEDA